MSALPLDEGQLIAGKYRVEHVLGEGAMGVVIAAWHLELNQRVAVKLVRPEAMTVQDAQERFRREARAAARLRSEHVVRVMDVGTLEGGTPYMVMEYLDGQDLARELSLRGPLPIAEAVGYILQASEALAEAHVGGIVHRDLKPANLFLARQPDGSRVIKVLDFGVSKATTHVPGSLSLTQDFAMIGSPLYMSPEQMRSAKDVDPRADIWALGVILFELLAGRPPFFEESIAELVRSMLEAPPSLRSLRAEVPQPLERAILRCLERDASQRYPDVGALASTLSRFAPEMRLHAERARRVLGGSGSQFADAANLASTVASASSAPSVSTPPTVTAWGDNPPRTRSPVVRRAGIASALVLLLFALFVGLSYSTKQSAPGAANAPGSAAPALVSVPAPPTSVVRPVEEPSTAAANALAASEPEPTPQPAVSARATGAPVKAAAGRKLSRPSAASSAVAKSVSGTVPDFGGRR
jgi:serine/threonine-protein kinase